MGRSTVHYADNKTNNALKQLHNKLRPAGTPVQRVEYIIELLLLRIFEAKLKKDDEFKQLRKLFTPDYRWQNPKTGKEESNENRLFSYLSTVSNEQIISELNDNFFPFYSTILQNARQVYTANLPQKVQDQLVLIEEVFSNSNFTNNVNSGNLGEVISIVTNDIDEDRLLKTDLLGDAIESALSETGGTKDIGLYRTPDHVRQFMTALVEPTFADTIFDPACGTGGFLFDAFEFVMRRIDDSQKWPGAKAHKELTKWLDSYFKNNQLEFPSIEQTTQFYRGGVTGIEYLGVIRKMAAINFYIRGLNPANIEQGDSLQKYNPVTEHESKSVILANPPFGAQRDQDAYPDVWSEYSKESETTILFVKLMFEHLRQGGRCAVVVSEGFHTWDQFSAKALRKMLLDEAQLKAVISLPQGLFVSKSGQGPKTSILLFEKGGKTDWTWFYKVTNDGYSMGTNRKEQAGCQLVECLDLFHNYVKKGIQPPESKNQFCIPVEWIKTLDPRVKDKIRTETRTELLTKGEIDRKKKIKDLDQKIKSKKITEADKQMELKVFDQMLENRIQNEIAKRIDKVHNYSFNMANYRSSLSDSQLAEWAEAISHIEPNGATTLDEIYRKLSTSKPDKILPYLVKLNPVNALEADIAREYINNVDENLVAEYKEIYTIKDILKSKQKYPYEKIGNYIIPKQQKIALEDEKLYKQVKIRLYGNGIGIRTKQFGSDIKTQGQYQVNAGDFIMSKIDARNGAFGIVTEELDGAVVTSSFPYFEFQNDIHPKYLLFIATNPIFYKKIEDMVSGATGRRSVETDDFLQIEIPIPSLDEQAEIVSKIEKQKAIIEGIELIEKNFDFDFENKYHWKKESLSDCCNELLIGNTPTGKIQSEGDVVYLKVNNLSFDLSLDFTNEYFIDKNVQDNDLKNSRCYPGDVLMNIVGPPLGKVAIVPDSIKECNINQAIICFRPKQYLDNRYLAYYLLKKSTVNRFVELIRRSTGQWNLTKTICSSFEIDIPEPDEQYRIVTELNEKSNTLTGLRKMKSEAKHNIDQLLADVWGVEYIETKTEEVVDD